MYALNNNVTYFDTCGFKHISRKIKRFIGNRNMQTNIFRIQPYDLAMFSYFCTEFIDFIVKGKTLTDFTNLFSPNNFFKKNDDIIWNYFKNGWRLDMYLDLNDQKFRLYENR